MDSLATEPGAEYPAVKGLSEPESGPRLDGAPRDVDHRGKTRHTRNSPREKKDTAA